MCSHCHAHQSDDPLTRTWAHIRNHGFTTVVADTDGYHPAWAHTIGLVEVCGHPELSLLGLPPSLASSVLGEAVRPVLSGQRYTPRNRVVIDHLSFEVREVDDRIWHSNLFDQWTAYCTWLGWGEPPASWALELVLACPTETWHHPGPLLAA